MPLIGTEGGNGHLNLNEEGDGFDGPEKRGSLDDFILGTVGKNEDEVDGVKLRVNLENVGQIPQEDEHPFPDSANDPGEGCPKTSIPERIIKK